MKREEIHAVHEENIDEFLRSIGLFEAIEKKELSCFCCNKKIGKDDFGCVFSYENKIRVCCDEIECLQKVLKIKKQGLLKTKEV